LEKKGDEKRKQCNVNKDTVFLKAFGIWRDDTEEHSYGKWENKGYYSWSGKPSPTKVTDGFNDFGQALVVNKDNSISVKYLYSKDSRNSKSEIVPKKFQIEDLVLFRWSYEWIKKKVENKFSKHGWFKCNMKNGAYSEIIFGKPIFITKFLEWVKNGSAIFDTRMKQRRPNNTDRYGMQWRANNEFWKNLATNSYPE